MVVLLQVLAVLAVVFGVAVVLTGRGEAMSEESQDLADTGIPRDRPMTAADVVGLRFALAFRGYRMAEVDDALDRLAAELADRDATIEALRAPTPDAVPAPEDPTAAEEPAYVPSDATGDLPEPPLPPEAPVLAAPDAGEPDGFEPEFREPEPQPDPEPEEPSIYSAFAKETEILAAEGAPSPFRPEVPDIPTYDPWSVTPRSRYTDGPTYVEVDEHPEDDVEAATEHQTGHAPAPAPEPADDAADGSADDDAPPPPPWRR